ncbi:hypothetical protein VFPPC_14821 [Pochonia chlamydosporia 170]|uniref:Uncharacterized protein n=1 Tax=Pochonia chlamydosporia 170 TaxID=1380566 RepID=A0A179F4J1_METCM|nr:hypothetical protein VFPPC_14821 [Pochonia chlamydosporia 170]OAQ60347.1 hypothetical protein VFPPC_14821 [Pochonia chlamydosporia 170]
MSLGVGKGTLLKQATIDHSPTTAIRSLHPSYAVYYNLEQKAYGQMLLICHFVLAFTLLLGSIEVPDWMEVIHRGGRSESQGIKPYLTVEFEGEKRGLVRTAYILQILRRMTNASPRKLCVQKTENEVARQQRYEISHLLSQLFASKYVDGSLEVARLCLLWKEYDHPRKETLIGRLIDLGSAQNWFQSPNSPEYLYPVIVGGGEDETGGTDVALAAEMGFLRLQGSNIPDCSAGEEIAVLARHHKTLAEQIMQVEMMGQKADQLAKFVALAIDLQATTNSPHVERLIMNIAGFSKDQYLMLQEIAMVVDAVPSLLLRDTDPIINEERPLRAIIHRPEIRVILDEISAKVELVVQLTISFVLQFSGLVAQGKVLCSASGLGNNEVGNKLMDTPLEFSDYVQNLRRKLRLILLLRDRRAVGTAN